VVAEEKGLVVREEGFETVCYFICAWITEKDVRDRTEHICALRQDVVRDAFSGDREGCRDQRMSVDDCIAIWAALVDPKVELDLAGWCFVF